MAAAEISKISHISSYHHMQKEGILVRNSYSLIHSKASKLLKRGEAQLENLWWLCGWCSHEVCGKTVIYSRSYSWYGSSVDPKSLKNPRVGVLESRLFITLTPTFHRIYFLNQIVFSGSWLTIFQYLRLSTGGKKVEKVEWISKQKLQ